MSTVGISDAAALSQWERWSDIKYRSVKILKQKPWVTPSFHENDTILYFARPQANKIKLKITTSTACTS